MQPMEDGGLASPAPFAIADVEPGYTRFGRDTYNQTWVGLVTCEGESVKCLMKAMSGRQLLNEVCCALIAQQMKLPVPKFYLALADRSLQGIDSEVKSEDGGAVLFASELKAVNSVVTEARCLHGTHAAGSISKWLLDSGHLGALYAFDEHCANTDRHADNLLLSSKSEIWLIDHGHALTGPDWVASDLVPASKFVSRLSSWCTPILSSSGKARTASEASAYFPAARQLNFDSIVEKLKVAGFLDEHEGMLLEEFLRIRIDYLSSMVSSSLNYPVAAA